MNCIYLYSYTSVSSFSYPSGEPPTPTKTPTSPNFFLNSFQTPKQDSRFNGSFSPWTPTFPPVASPGSKTPTRLSFAASIKKPTKATAAKNVEAEIASHVHHLSPNPSLPVALVEPPRQSSLSPRPSTIPEAKRRRLNSSEASTTPLKTTFDQEASLSMNSAGSMQTPPPTSNSASRRKAQQAQVARLVKESAEKGKKLSFQALTKVDSMEDPTGQVDESPQHFSTLQFSPEGLGFQTSGPATAPVYPQHKLFWDPEQSGDPMNIEFPMDDTFTAFSTLKTLDPFTSSHDIGGIQFPTSPAFNLLGTRGEAGAPFTSSIDADPAIGTSSSVAMARKLSRSNGVDPSLLFSSPSRTAEASHMPLTSQEIQDDNLKPYAHQLRDAQMEMEMQLARKSKRKRAPENDSPAVKAALQTLRDDQAGIKRDLADDASTSSDTQRPPSRVSGRLMDQPVTELNTLQRHRKTSQLQPPGNGLPLHKRTSVTLTIDASGRAKTETKVLRDQGKSMGARMEPDRNEDSDSASSDSTDVLVTSQSNSFANPPLQKQPKLGRFTHRSQSHSQKSSYTSTLGSKGNRSSTSEIDRRKTSSNLTIQSNIQSRHPRVSFNDHSVGEEESEAETVIDSEDDKGNAQSALKKVLQSRRRSSNKPSLPRSSQNAPPHPYYMQSFTPTRDGYNQAYNNTSPTTITDPDLATPDSRSSTINSDSVRCLCHGGEDDGQLMIQCESCRKWQHVRCLGLPLDPQKLPTVHLCVFCTSTPNVRGGRMREPSRAAFPPPSSPLAHKSHRYR